MLQDLTGGEPVPAAQDQDVARLRDPAERRMNQRLVVTIFVAGGELKIAVEEEPEIVAAAGEDDPLERRRFGVDDRLLVTRRFRPALPSVRHREPRDQDREDQHRRHLFQAQLGSSRQYHEQCQRDAGIGDPEQEAGADHPEIWDQQEREKERGRQRDYIVEGQNGRYHLLATAPFAQNPYQQRDLK